MSTNGQVLHWTGRVLSADDLRRSLNGQRELVLPERAVITPLAAEHLRANGVQIRRQTRQETPATTAAWGIAQERPHPLVRSAVESLARDGLSVRALQPEAKETPCRWAQAIAECIARGECRGGVVFCDDGGLVCCVANKVSGLRAAAAASVAQAARAVQTLGANLVAIELAGRTFFEVRQILRTVCAAGEPTCPPSVATTLGELEAHAHR
jgi:ribose 5-phosphate isomerase RpiB